MLTPEVVEKLNTLAAQGILWIVSNKVGSASFNDKEQGEVYLWSYYKGHRYKGYGTSGFRSGGIRQALDNAMLQLMKDKEKIVDDQERTDRGT